MELNISNGVTATCNPQPNKIDPQNYTTLPIWTFKWSCISQMELLQPATRNPIKLIFRITLHYQYQISIGVSYLKWGYCNLQPATQQNWSSELHYITNIKFQMELHISNGVTATCNPQPNKIDLQNYTTLPIWTFKWSCITNIKFQMELHISNVTGTCNPLYITYLECILTFCYPKPVKFHSKIK